MFSKILPGGAAEQAGKLGEGRSKYNILEGGQTHSAENISFFPPLPAISGFGKKFTSFF